MRPHASICTRNHWRASAVVDSWSGGYGAFSAFRLPLIQPPEPVSIRTVRLRRYGLVRAVTPSRSSSPRLRAHLELRQGRGARRRNMRGIPPGSHRRTDERLHISGPLVALHCRPRHSGIFIHPELGEGVPSPARDSGSESAERILDQRLCRVAPLCCLPA